MDKQYVILKGNDLTHTEGLAYTGDLDTAIATVTGFINRASVREILPARPDKDCPNSLLVCDQIPGGYFPYATYPRS